MVGADRFGESGHAGFRGGSAAFFRIALSAGGNEVLPGILSATGSGKNMIDRQRLVGSAAILAAERIPSENVFPVQHDFLEGDADKYIQADDARQGKMAGNAAEHLFRMVGNRHGLAAEEQKDGFACIADT